MSTSDTDLDDQLRAAMKVLDAEVPSGYFEALPDQTLSRLEASSMQGTSGTTENKVSAAPPPVGSENTEDSGLHDIRNLAQSTKQRISSKRITSSQPVLDDPASSSGGWKAIALPQPAKMVALPELDELPSKKDIKAAEKAAAKERKQVEAAADIATAKAAVEASSAPARAAFSLPSAAQKKSKAPLFALVGLGLAAAAGAAIYVTTQKKAEPAQTTVARADVPAATAAVTATPIQQNAAVGGAAGSGVASADVQKAEDEAAKTQAENDAMKAQLAATTAAAGDTGKDKAAAAPAVKAPSKKGHGTAKVDTGGKKVEETKQAPADTKTKTKVEPAKPDKADKNADGSEPDFNDLLKEAGVNEKKDTKPKLDKKSLTGDDFKKGMSSIEDKAHGCYKGTQGSAMVKLTIAPSGKITKIAVTGPFAGKPEAACVAAAVRGATFPAWDGGPESFTYPILLSE